MLQKKRRNESDRELVARLFGMKKAAPKKAYAYSISRAEVESVDMWGVAKKTSADLLWETLTWTVSFEIVWYNIVTTDHGAVSLVLWCVESTGMTAADFRIFFIRDGRFADASLPFIYLGTFLKWQ